MSQLKQGQKVLVIRYGKKKDCIEKHCDVINQIGYCWFGKIGVIPSKKAIDAVVSEDRPAIVLYSQGNAYIANVDSISYDKPDEGYPDYYNDELFDNMVFPKSYYKITDISPLDKDVLKKIKVVSSGSPIVETLNKSMSSFFFAEYGKAVNRKTKEINEEVKNDVILEVDDCIYKKDGLCNKKGFVNYKYACERPSSCMGQKR